LISARGSELEDQDGLDKARGPGRRAAEFNGAHHQLGLIHAEAERRNITVHILLDFVHVAEYVWAAAHAFHTPATARPRHGPPTISPRSSQAKPSAPPTRC
jgi:hypothetical protein